VTCEALKHFARSLIKNISQVTSFNPTFLLSNTKMNFARLILIIFVCALIAQYLGYGIEGWASSPGTLIQLSASSGYYPFWQYGYGYRYPYYRYMYPYYNDYNSPQHAHFPKPYGTYKYY